MSSPPPPPSTTPEPNFDVFYWVFGSLGVALVGICLFACIERAVMTCQKKMKEEQEGGGEGDGEASALVAGGTGEVEKTPVKASYMAGWTIETMQRPEECRVGRINNNDNITAKRSPAVWNQFIV